MALHSPAHSPALSPASVAVIGGGAMGSAAAWQLALRGHPVVLFEQFGPGHRRGASHGSSRIFRHAYAHRRRLSDAAARAAADVKVADLLVIATPTYKASFTGLLKLFLDVLPAGSLASTVVVPLTVSGGPAHRHWPTCNCGRCCPNWALSFPPPRCCSRSPSCPTCRTSYGAMWTGTGR